MCGLPAVAAATYVGLGTALARGRGPQLRRGGTSPPRPLRAEVPAPGAANTRRRR
jgi:hypothetical protein